MSRAKPKFDGNKEDMLAPFYIGEEHAREWLKNPWDHPLTTLRLEFQRNVVDIVQSKNETGRANKIPDAAILDCVSMYNAGVDKVLQEFIFLALAEPTGEYQ